VSLAQALGEWGLSPETLLAARHPGALAYLEAHIEQGPVLEAEGLALGVVTGSPRNCATRSRFAALPGTRAHRPCRCAAMRWPGRRK
jgi:hypothetical protein